MCNKESIVFLKSEDIQTMLDMDSSTIINLIKTKVLLCIELASGELAFPEFQFQNGELFPELISLSQKFPNSTNGWEITCWLYKWNENLKDYPKNLLWTKENRERLALTISTEASISLI